MFARRCYVELLGKKFVLEVGVCVEVKVDFVARLDILKLFHLQLVQILKAVLFIFFNYCGHLTLTKIASKRLPNDENLTLIEIEYQNYFKSSKTLPNE